MILIIAITIYATLGIVAVLKEIATPYGGDFWLLHFLFAPYTLISDFIQEYKEARKLDNPNR